MKAPIVKRNRGRPTKEEGTAIATEKAILDYRLKMALLLPTAVETLEGLMTSGTEKVKEGTAKFIINEAKEVFSIYTAEDNEDNEAGGTVSASSENHSGSSEEFKNMMPLTTQIREYKMVEGDE